ncbi:MAG: alpha/beta fold hydrolase, partial [Gammaproteobacteria bacterium]
DAYHAVAWDARGYGNSDDYDGPLDFADFAADLLRLLDHLGCARAHLCGLSMGGRIALDFHDRHADRVASLVLVDTFPGYDASFTQEGRERFVRERRQPLLDGRTVADIAPAVAASLVSPHAPPEVVQQLVDSMCRLHQESYLKTIEAMTMYQPVSDVSRIQVPVQIIVGADDRLTPPKISRRMAEQIPHAQLCVLAETGHLSNLERPDAFDDCLRGFLDGLA